MNTKIMVFRKGGILPRLFKFYYGDKELEIVTSFSYLGIVFTPGVPFLVPHSTPPHTPPPPKRKKKKNVIRSGPDRIFKLKRYPIIL